MTAIQDQLRIARHTTGLSQKALGQRIGLPQSHVSAIENGKVDPRLSSVLELARHLDQELMLIPRAFLPAVRALLTGETGKPLWQSDDEGDSQ